MENYELLIGVPYKESDNFYKGMHTRAIKVDGKDTGYSDDVDENRINVAIENGIITEILYVG